MTTWLRGAHQAPAYESRRDGVCVAFEKVNGANPFRLLTMTREHLYAGILAAARRKGVEILTARRPSAHGRKACCSLPTGAA